MSLAWQFNKRVYVGAHSLQTSHGPALAVLGTKLIMVYVGQGSDNLWFATIDTTGTDFSLWPTNERVKTAGGRSPKASYAPALAVLDGVLHMVYTGSSGTDLWWSWYDGQWHGDIKLGLSGHNPNPALASLGGKLHVVYNGADDGNGKPTLQHSTSNALVTGNSANWSANDWHVPQLIGTDTFPALATIGRQAHLVTTRATAISTDANIAHGSLPENGPVNLSVLQLNIGTPVTSGGEGIVAFGAATHVIYRGSGGDNMWDVVLDNQGAPTSNTQIKVSNSALKTSATMGVAVYRGKVCVAYKGDSSDNLWFAFGT